MELCIFLLSGAVLLALVLPRVDGEGRVITAAGALAGAVMGTLHSSAMGEDPKAPPLVGISLLLWAAILSTRGRPHLLYDGSVRLPPVDEPPPVLNRRRWIFMAVFCTITFPYLWITTA